MKSKRNTIARQALSTGYFPAEDHEGNKFSETHHKARFMAAGKPLTLAGKVGAFSEQRGDWSYLQAALRLRQFWSTNYCCHLRRAYIRIRRLLFTDFRRQAVHRKTLYTNAQWLSWARQEFNRSPLLEIPGFNIWRVWADVMHTMDLGILQWANASALFALTDKADVWVAPKRKARLYKAHEDYLSWSAVNGCGKTAPRFEEKKLRPSTHAYPCFTQRQRKASSLRAMQYWLHDVCAAAAREHPSDGYVLMAGLFENLVRLDVITRRADRYLNDSEAEMVAEAREKALCAYNALADLAIRQNEYLWKFVPKFHMCTRIFYDMAPFANPRRVHCYADEDMVGKGK